VRCWFHGGKRKGAATPCNLLGIADRVFRRLAFLVLRLPLTRIATPRTNVAIVPTSNEVRRRMTQDLIILFTDNPLEPIVRPHTERKRALSLPCDLQSYEHTEAKAGMLKDDASLKGLIRLVNTFIVNTRVMNRLHTLWVLALTSDVQILPVLNCIS
jgi:hypothetical protein